MSGGVILFAILFKHMLPLISVVIPAYNAGKTISVALRSMVSQTYPWLEIIAVDDQSTDETREVILKFAQKHSNIKYVQTPFVDHQRHNWRGENINAGWLARNVGVNQSRGEWITFQDADDASFLNRIAVQYKIAQRFRALHVCIDWQKFAKNFVCEALDLEPYRRRRGLVISAQYLAERAQLTRGKVTQKGKRLYRYLPFAWKKIYWWRRFFFAAWDPYPCAGNSPLVKRDVFRKVHFRPLAERVWPSPRGRGADRDFNFQVAATFQNSICVRLPLYLWRVKTQNPDYVENKQNR